MGGGIMGKIILALLLFTSICQTQPRKIVMHVDTVADVARIYPGAQSVVEWERLRCVDTTIREYWHAGWTDKHSLGYFDINWKNIPIKRMDVFLRLEN
jgi:hypothetical protein